MSRIIKLGGAIILLVFSVTFFSKNFLQFSRRYIPCKEPIPYTIGTFDRRFALSHQDFRRALLEAEAIWEKPLGRELFIYEPQEADLPINLIYDYRQEVTSTLNDLEHVVEEGETTYDTLQTKYLGLKRKYDEAKSAYNARLKAFNIKSNGYEVQVQIWNSGQRTSREQFDKLESDKAVLQQEVAGLKSSEAQINQMAQEINKLVERLNHLAESLNLKVDTYNTIGASRGDSFTGGLYHSDEDGQEIDIYEFSTKEKLVRILAHELGHALGLEHVADREAIMYHLNQGESKALTQGDLAALEALCYTEDIKN